MDLNDSPEQAAYRAEVRAWLEEHKQQAPPRSGSYEDANYVDSRRAWQRQLAEAGLAGVTWPAEYGGQGKGPIEQVTLNQEIARAQVPGILDVIGIGMLGPCLIAHGTEDQKAGILVRCSTATRCGVRCSPSPPPALTSRRCRRGPARTTMGAGR